MSTRRFRSMDDATFWEITVEGRTVITRFGQTGTEGTTNRRDESAPTNAQRLADTLVKQKVDKGFRELIDAPAPARQPRRSKPTTTTGSSPRNPQLEAAIDVDLDDPAPYLVYADWLQGQGDPLGELIVRQQRGDPSADAFLAEHAERFLGPLCEFPDDPDGRGVTIEWRNGFIEHLGLRWDDFESSSDDEPERQLLEILKLPTARFLESLELGPYPSDDEMSLQPLVEVVRSFGGPSTLRALTLGHLGAWDISSTATGDFGSIHHLFPKLEWLRLRGGAIQFGERVSLPALEELHVETGGLDRGTLLQICGLKAPKLGALSIWFGSENYGASGSVADLSRVLSGEAFPRLHHLGIMNCAWVDDAVQALIASPVLPKLTSLDLSMGCLSDAAVELMLRHRQAFAHLGSINLADNALTAAGIEKAPALCARVTLGEQDPDKIGERGARYVSVGE